MSFNQVPRMNMINMNPMGQMNTNMQPNMFNPGNFNPMGGLPISKSSY